MRSHPFHVPVLLALLTALTVPGAASGRNPAERSAEASGAGAAAGPEQRDGFAARLDDLWITALAKGRLLRNEEVDGLAVDVDARDGVVTLFGMVPTLSAQAAAELELMKVDGVRRIENLLEVVPEPEQDATRAHDRALERVLRERLDAQPETGQADLDVEICNSVARLRGSVASAAEHGAVVEIARDTDGVREVVDQLQIDGRPATSEHAASF